MAKNEERVIDWDDQITDDGEYSGEESVVLPEGNYPFEVIKVEKAWYDGSNKIPACNMMKVFLRVDGGELGKALCVENIYLIERLEWKASAYARSIGLKKHNEPIKWSTVVDKSEGQTGRCRIYVDDYTDRDGNKRQSNKIKTFFDYEEQAPKKEFKRGAF